MRQGRSKFLIQGLLFIFVLSLSACGREEENTGADATVSIRLSAASAQDIALRESRPDSWWNPQLTSEEIERRNLELKNEYESSQLRSKASVGIMAVGSENWGLSGIGSSGDIDCFVVAVSVPEDSGSGTCLDDDGVFVADVSVIAGPVNNGENLTLTVPSGSARTIYAIGIRTSDGGCDIDTADASRITFSDRATLSPPMIIGSITVDLDPGENTVTIPATVSTSEPEIESCTGGPFAWDNGSICQDSTFSSAAMFTHGLGTATSPWLICTGAQMNEIGNGSNDATFGDHFKLMDDIDLSSFTGTSYNVIGTAGTNFTGEFDGNDYTIDGFTYNDSSLELGLFGVTNGATIQDMSVTNVNVAFGDQSGTIVGDGTSTTVDNVFVSGIVTNNINGQMGCMIGICTSCTLSNLDTTCTIPSSAGNVIGGIVAETFTSASITNVEFSGSMTISTTDTVGGIVGRMGPSTVITNATMSGSISGQDNVGGIVGLVNTGSSKTISNATISGTVSGNDSVGGVVGDTTTSGLSINTCTVTGNVSGTSSDIGGVIGHMSNGSTVTSCLVNGITITGGSAVGGIAGEQNGSTTISLSGVTGVTINPGGNVIGGITGSCPAAGSGIQRSYFNGTINASGRNFVGGIAGTYAGDISDVYSKGNLTALANIGGIIGRYDTNASVTNAYSTMTINVGSTGTPDAGGIVGGQLSAPAAAFLLHSWFGGSITASASGNIFKILGNVCSGCGGTTTNVNENSTTIVCTNAGGGACTSDEDGSFTSAQLQTSATSAMYSNWDFVSDWEEVSGDFPILRNVSGQ